MDLKASNQKKGIWVILSLIVFCFATYTCPKADDPQKSKSGKSIREKGEYQEYLIDSLKAADRLKGLAIRTIQLLGKPLGEGLYTKYDEYLIKNYRFDLSSLRIKDDLAVVKTFYDKYRARPESKFWSHWTIHTCIISIEDIDKYINERNWYMVGIKLGIFIYRVSTLIRLQDEFWLLTEEDLKIMRDELEKEVKRQEEERARLLGEKFREKKK